MKLNGEKRNRGENWKEKKLKFGVGEKKKGKCMGIRNKSPLLYGSKCAHEERVLRTTTMIILYFRADRQRKVTRSQDWRKI